MYNDCLRLHPTLKPKAPTENFGFRDLQENAASLLRTIGHGTVKEKKNRAVKPIKLSIFVPRGDVQVEGFQDLEHSKTYFVIYRIRKRNLVLYFRMTNLGT